MAGGDGSLITMLMKAKDVGIDISKLLCVSLPYGTGNDFCKVTNWGILPEADFYKTLHQTVKEICFNTDEESVDIWDIKVKYREGGDTFQIDSRTRRFSSLNMNGYHRYMINYFSIGSDAKIGCGKLDLS